MESEFSQTSNQLSQSQMGQKSAKLKARATRPWAGLTRLLRWSVQRVPRWAMILISLVVLLIGVTALDRAGVIDVLPRGHVHLSMAPDTGRPLVPANFEDISAVQLVVRGESNRFERGTDGRWFRVNDHAEGSASARAYPGISATLNGMLKIFAAARIKKEIEAGGEVSEYGVLRPPISVAFYARGERRPLIRYFIGDHSEDGSGRYAMIFGTFELVVLPAGRVADLEWLAQAFAPAAME